MRTTIPQQRHLFTSTDSHPLARTLAEADRILLAHSEWEQRVHEDLTRRRGVRARLGRRGLSGRTVLRVCVLKHLLNVSLRKLASLIADSLALREFLGLGLADKAPKRSRLQDNLARIRAETWGWILGSFLGSAEARQFEAGEKARADATVVESTIHAPSDSSLLWDCVRTLTRLMTRGYEQFQVEFSDHRRSAKRAHRQIYWARKQSERAPAYRVLLAATRKVVAESEVVWTRLRRVEPTDVMQYAQLQGLLAELAHYQELTARVIDQTERRVLHGEKVPAQEKVYSIFEPHTDMIVKGKNRPAEFGHKVTLTMGVHFVLDAVIERGNPADVTLAVRQVQRLRALYSRAPKQVAMDGGYTSSENLAAIKELGVERCAFSKGRGLTAVEMSGSRRTHGRLKRFRAGIEGKISWLKRDFGLKRCTWKGWARFQAYVWSALFAANLSKLVSLRLSGKGATSACAAAA